MYRHVWGACMTTTYMWRSEDNIDSQFSPSNMWVPVIKLQLSGLAANTFIS